MSIYKMQFNPAYHQKFINDMQAKISRAEDEAKEHIKRIENISNEIEMKKQQRILDDAPPPPKKQRAIIEEEEEHDEQENTSWKSEDIDSFFRD